ncbi:hypothetical protein QQF64_011996 [Cirrhinus molitorella]|uniref:Uncharacterized protein n=1 Tax=Cirrhinus molitorella TaxID=172907 RepID=A0ABR3LWR9_9TELE
MCPKTGRQSSPGRDVLQGLMVEESASSSKDAETRPPIVAVAEVEEQDHTTSFEPRMTSAISPLCSLKVEKADSSVPSEYS